MTGIAALCGLVSLSAIVTKASQATAPLQPLTRISVTKIDQAAITMPEVVMAPAAFVEPLGAPFADTTPINDPLAVEVESTPIDQVDASLFVADTSIRFFNGRPVRPARTITMRVTGYSPDEASCPGTADNITSSNHDVFTNAMKLVAADSRVLPLGSIISVPGYDNNNVVPVLDRGGAIKGNKLDLLFPTHNSALKWGAKTLTVTVYEYADGLPADDYRKIRDSRN